MAARRQNKAYEAAKDLDFGVLTLDWLSLRNKRQGFVQPPRPQLEGLLLSLCPIRAGNTTQNMMDDFTSTLILAWLPCSELTLCELDTTPSTSLPP